MVEFESLLIPSFPCLENVRIRAKSFGHMTVTDKTVQLGDSPIILPGIHYKKQHVSK